MGSQKEKKLKLVWRLYPQDIRRNTHGNVVEHWVSRNEKWHKNVSFWVWTSKPQNHKNPPICLFFGWSFCIWNVYWLFFHQNYFGSNDWMYSSIHKVCNTLIFQFSELGCLKIVSGCKTLNPFIQDHVPTSKAW